MFLKGIAYNSYITVDVVRKDLILQGFYDTVSVLE